MSCTEIHKLELQLQKLMDDDAPLTRILNTSERLLALDPNHIKALTCKSVCCLTRDKYGAAITLLERIQQLQPSIVSSPSFAFRKSYALYRLRQYAEAKGVLDAAGGRIRYHTPSRHLRAQIHYNLEEYADAVHEYIEILKDEAYRDEQEKTEIITNLSAAYSACQPAKAVETFRMADEKTLDVYYNAATALIASRDMSGAMKLLIQAEVLCAKEHPKTLTRSLEEALLLTEGDAIAKMGVTSITEDRRFFNEAANLWVQMAYVWQMVGEKEKASTVLQLILTLKPTSVATNAVASTNWAAMKGDADFFDVGKKLKMILNSNFLDRLTSKQLLSLRYNYALLNFRYGSKSTCRRELEILKRDYPEHYLTYGLQLGMMALEAGKKQKPSHDDMELLAKKVETAAAKSTNGTSSTPFLTVNPILAEIYLQQGDLQRVANILSDDQSALSRSPSAVITIASWRVRMGDIQTGFDYLEKEITQMPPPVAAKVIQWMVDDFSTNCGLHAETGASLERLWKKLPWLSQSKEMSALRCFVLSFSDITAARGAALQFKDNGEKVGPTTLKSLSRWQPSRQDLEALGYRRTISDEGAQAAAGIRHRRQRKMRRPPKEMTDKKIDPERWIPMKQRSYIIDLPERRKRELRRLRAIEQDRLRRIAEKRQQELRQNELGKDASSAP